MVISDISFCFCPYRALVCMSLIPRAMPWAGNLLGFQPVLSVTIRNFLHSFFF